MLKFKKKKIRRQKVNRYLLLFSHYIERPLPHPAFSLQIHLMILPFFYLSWFRMRSFTITCKVVEFSLSGYKSLHMMQVRAFTELTILLMPITYHLITEYHTCSEATHYMWLTCQINRWPWLHVDVSEVCNKFNISGRWYIWNSMSI